LPVYTIDPLTDPRWAEFVERTSRASIFHTPGWLQVLRATYDYEPVAYTTSGPTQDLENGIVFCRISSWLTGKRMVSVPFSDHCDPLVDDEQALSDILNTVKQDCIKLGMKYWELRCRNALTPIPPISTPLGKMGPSAEFAFHALDLRPDEELLYSQLHKTAIKQMLGRAEREELTYSVGQDETHLKQFYSLLLKTRRKHQVPPQPMLWFRNLAHYLDDNIKFHIAFKNDSPIASIVTTSYKSTECHKYGCSDVKFSNLGGTQFLLWQAIRDARSRGALEFDQGRSDKENKGLIRFKERWGGQRNDIVYHRLPAPETLGDEDGWKAKLAKQAFSHMPDRLLGFAGSLLYKHVG